MTRAFRYGIAVLSVVAALTLRLALDPIIGPSAPYFTFLLCVLVTARYAGRGPGLLAAGLSLLAARYFLFEPRYSFAIRTRGVFWTLVILAATGITVSQLASRPSLVPVSESDGRLRRTTLSFPWRAGLLGVALLLLAVFTHLLYSDFERQQDRQRWAAHTYEVLNEIGILTSALEDAETGQRGYLLTGERQYLEPYHAALLVEQAARQALVRLTADDPEQQVRLAALDPLVAAKLSALQTTISLRETKGVPAALAVVRTHEGKRFMDSCRAILQAIQGAERDLLRKRSDAFEAEDRRTRWVLGLGTSSLVILLVFAGAVIERDTQNQERARQAGRRSEERLRLALDCANAGTWEWDLRTNENVWSEELWKVYGLEPHSCHPSFESWRRIVHPDDRADAERIVAKAAREGTELNVEFRIRGGDGSDRWLLARAQPLKSAAGLAECYVGIALDITARKQAEEALRERERNLRRFTEAAPVAIAMFERDMRYLAVSQRFRDDYKLGSQELIGHSHYEIFPEIPELWREIHRRCLAGAVERHTGERFQRADGGEQWVRWEIQPWRQQSGEIGGIVLFSEDNTGQRRAEQAREESEARLRLAQQVARIGTFERDLHSGFAAWTPELEAIYGLPEGGSPKTLKDWESLIHPEDRARTLQKFNQAIDTGRFEAEWRVMWPDGGVRWLAGRGSVFRDESGTVARMIGVNIDVTEAKQAEQELRQAHAELKEAQRVGHLGNWYWEVGTNIITGSEELYSIFGIDPKQPLPRYDEQERMYSAESWKQLNSAVKTAARTGIIFETDAELHRGDGTTIWVTARGEAVRDTGGNIVGFRGTLQEVTRRKQAEDEIRERNAVLHAISQVFHEAYTCETEEALRKACQSVAEELTGSSFGFIGGIGTPGCEEKSFYINDPQAQPDRMGLPPGHPPLTAFMAVPLTRAGQTIGRIAVANRAGGYGPRELESLESLASAIVQVMIRKQAEAAQRESEAQFRTLANAIPQLCSMASADGFIFWFNQRWYDYTGTTLEQVEGWGWQSVHDPALLPKVLDRWKASIATGQPFEMVFPLRGADGTFHPFLTRIMPVRDRDGKVVRWIGTNTDITEQLATEAALRQASEHRRLAIEAAELEAWDYTIQNGEVQTHYMQAISGVHPDDRSHTDNAVREALTGADGGAYHQEFRLVRPDGSVHWVASHGKVHFESGTETRRAMRFIGVNMDITERKRAELEIRQLNAELEQRVRQRTAELETANKELEAFSYSVSHDLRAPLRGIDGWSLALAEDYAEQLDGRALKYLDRVRSETQRMGILIDDMLKLSRVSSSEMRLAPVDLTGIVRGIAEGFTESNSDRNIDFVIEPGLCVAGDARLLEIALTNLLANAVKFTGTRDVARIEFGMEANSDAPIFYVQDNGVGFDMTYAGALFGAFQRLHKSSEFPGTGIGLAIVQRVIHRHRGRVWAEARRDRGATFFFTVGKTG